MDTAFVTGATGFVGSTLVDDLLARGVKVRCAVRKTSNLRWLDGKDVEICHVDLMDSASIRAAMEGCSYIYHLAGTLFAGSRKEYIEGNQKVSANMIEAILEQDKPISRFVYVSTIIAAGASPDSTPMKESDECRPFSWYGMSKYESEQYILSFKDRIPVTILRPGAVYGPRDYAMFTSFKFSRTGINIVLGERDKLGSIIHVKDLTMGIIDAAYSENSLGEVYFLANEEFMKQEEFGEKIIRAMGKKPFDIIVPYALLKFASTLSEIFSKMTGRKPLLNHQKLLELSEPFIICSPEKAVKDFGFQTRISLEEGIRSTLEWYREYKWL